MAKIQWTAKYQILIFIIAEIMLSEATPVGRTSFKVGGKHPVSKKPTLTKASLLKAAKTGFQAEGSLPQQYFSSPYIQNLISSHDNNNNVGSGWYGFQRFIPRQSRMLNDRNGREESLYFLGEKRPMTSTSPDFKPRDHDHSVPQPQQQNYHYVQYESDVSQGDNDMKNNENSLPLINTQLLRSPVPVTLRIIPLKMTSHEIAQALRKMHWLPVPMSLPPEFTYEGREQEDRDQPVYEIHHEHRGETESQSPMYQDRSYSEPNYPPPSSHVATPLESPPAITYDRGMSFESYDGTSFFPSTFSKP